MSEPTFCCSTTKLKPIVAAHLERSKMIMQRFNDGRIDEKEAIAQLDVSLGQVRTEISVMFFKGFLFGKEPAKHD